MRPLTLRRPVRQRLARPNATRWLPRREAIRCLISSLMVSPLLLGSGRRAAGGDPGPGAVGSVWGRRATGDSIFKQRARADYQQNMSKFGGRLSAEPAGLLNQYARGTPWQFDILVVGSGYGASITAARLSARLRPGGRLGILERGREWVPGSFPDTLPDVVDESRLKLLGKAKGQIDKPTGLFNVQQFEEITIFSGSGLGGSSLINANVAFRPDAEVFEQAVWPQMLRDRAYWEPYFELAEYELGVAREPLDHTYKMVAQRRAWEALADSGASYEAARLTLTRAPQARGAGGQLPVLVLGAGSLGSSEILMRSQSRQLQLSQRLGCAWTGNGDALGFIRKSRYPTGIGGYSAYCSDRAKVGPTIQTNLTYPQRSLAGRVLIQDGAVSRAYATALGILKRDLDLDQTLVLLGMGHDGAGGRMFLNEQGFAQVTWPGLLEGDYRKLIRGEFARVAEALGGEYEYLRIFGDRMISVHPLGGCGMSDDPAHGVVNHCGQVYDAEFGGDFDPQTGRGRVHEGLYVVDGAMLPTSIGCNPLLTISALAERSADHLIAESGLRDLFTTDA